MKLEDIENLDLYKCSLKDINKAYRVLKKHIKTLYSSDGKGNYSEYFLRVRNLYGRVFNAKTGKSPKGYMISGYNPILDRLPNSESKL